MLINYFPGRKGFVRWNGFQSETKDIFGGGPQGGFLGILEYLSQSNNNADMFEEDDGFKLVDDLTLLEILNLLSIVMSSFIVKVSVPSDIPNHNGFIPSEHLKTQE